MRPITAAAAALLAAGCVESPDALRNAGEDCGSCHRAGGKAPEHPFTAAGSVFATPDGPPARAGARGVVVALRDAGGREVRLETNSAGNFATERALRFPVAATIEDPATGRRTVGPVGRCTAGSCDLCHAPVPAGGARGRLLSP